MARLRVRNGETVTTETIVGAGDSLNVDIGGAIVRTGGSPAVRLTGNDAIVRNAGRIAVEGANGAALLGSFTGMLDVRLTNTGTIEGQSVAISLSSADGTTGNVRLVNLGTIDGGAGNALAMRDLRATSILIYNADGATITNAGTADVVRPGHDLLTAIRVDNAGSIIAGKVVGASSSGDGIDLQSQDGGVAATIINRGTGTIEGGKHAVTGANAAYIHNEAGGRLIGRNGSGLNFDTSAADGDGEVAVVNHGLISGRYDGFGDGDGDGVDVDYLVDVRNYGRIEGVGADNIDDFADGIAAGGGVIYNAAGAQIFGETNGILIDDGDRNGAFAATRLTNEGTISATLGTAVRFIGSFDDTIVNSGKIESVAGIAIDTGDGADSVNNSGAIVGDVYLGGGADLYRAVGGSVDGIIYAGAGDDRLFVGDVAAIVDGGDGADSVLGGAGFDRLSGGNGDDALYGGEGRDALIGGRGADILFGGEGKDRLFGGAGQDLLHGGGGDDVFAFARTLESSGVAAEADRILDYAEGDTIDVSLIDADTALSGDQAFAWIGSAAFSGAAGQLRTEVSGGDTIIACDVDGDAVADFALVVVGVADPTLISIVF
jgi:RTX calcium-binding nonapeptide repeat (4 copies)